MPTNIAETADVIFIDHSIHSTFSCCEEKGRLAYIEHLVPIATRTPLEFGKAFHAGVAGLYNSIFAGMDRPQAILEAQRLFVHEAKDSLRLTDDLTANPDPRTIERGCNMIEAYAQKYAPQDAHWTDVVDPNTNTPWIEVGFSVHLMDWRDKPVVLVGKVDRIRRYRVDGNLYGWETKTTTSGTKRYADQVRPNHQITGYQWAIQELLGLNVVGMILDIAHISDRKVGGKFPTGVDAENDFLRVETRRSPKDIEEFLFDLRLKTIAFLERRDSGLRRWHRNAPAACYMYGGCHFLEACRSNLNPRIMQDKYKVEPWHPFKDSVKHQISFRKEPLR